ncbi:outer membrane protein assembly factor BamA [Sunxiuqinia sp. A32]|uniref:outer membrane protein assembly factor BamA n=1 Tax=Sunxiuqinia sp. A32 TaxID=3461496 RepID=UPI0040467A5B
MKKSFLLIGCLFFAGSLLFQLAAQNNYEVRKINFHGNKTLDKEFLLDQMALKEVSFLQKLLTSEERFLYNQELIKLDLERLVRIYQSEGFLNAETKLNSLKVNKDKQSVRLNFEVEEGNPILVDSVTILYGDLANTVNTDSVSARIFRKLNLTKGKRFRDEAISSDVLFIEDVFRNLGYAYAKVKYDLDLDVDRHSTQITYTIIPGPLCRIGETMIIGNKHVSSNFINKQLEYSEGETYDKSLLAKTREDLYNLQLFRVVSVLPDKDSESLKNPIPVRLYVEEAPRFDTRFGVGYGTEDKFRTFIDLNYRGFWGGARRLNLYVKHSALEPYNISLKWIQPQFFSKKSSLAFNPFINRISEPGYDTRTYGMNIPLAYRFNDHLNSKLIYYLENVEQTVEEGDIEFQDYVEDKFPYNKSGILFSTVFDDAKPRFSPIEGVNVSVGFKVNGHLFGGDFNYTRLWADLRTYQKAGKWVIAVRTMAGGINSSDDSQFIPVEDRFYSGGSNSVRGWSRSQLGPKRESGTPLGGKSILEGNLELRYPLFWRVSGVAFMDTGNVWTESYSYHINNLGYASGGGLRVDTPIGPIRFDVGFPLWNEKKSAQFFISVGQAF